MFIKKNYNGVFAGKRCFWLVAILFSLSCYCQTAKALSDNQIKSLNNRFAQRARQSLFQIRDDKLNIAEKRSPLSPGRGLYTRHFSFSIVNFAMKSFLLGTDVETANDALKTYAEFYISDRLTRNDRDSFYWAADVLCRIVEFYGENGSKSSGLLSKDTQELINEMMWLYAKENSKVDALDETYETYAKWQWGQMGDVPLPACAEVKRSKTWDVIESENHHMMKYSTLWHFARLLSKADNYKERKYDDGYTAREHYAAWTEYAKEYCRQRSRLALFIEMADDGYNTETVKCLYNFYDFSSDDSLKELAGNLITLYYASWAQEQINGIRGGGKSRMNGQKPLRTTSSITQLMWLYAGMGEAPKPHGYYFTVMTSGYRLPDVVIDMVLDVEGRGCYEVADCPPGLAEGKHYGNPHYRLRDDDGGIVRYSYCTPDFVMGLPVVEARAYEDWTMISSQSRWQGVIFAGKTDARIFPECKPEKEGSTFNQQWGVQSKGTMISQRLKEDFTRGTEGMKVWISTSFDNRIETDGWVFVESQGAYAAVRPARGGYSWKESELSPKTGLWMVFEDGYSPVIIEVARKRDIRLFNDFQAAVKELPLQWDNSTLSYTSLSGDNFKFYADYSQKPKINGEAFDYKPKYVFNSPFVKSERGSGIVRINKDNRELVLDFNYVD